MLRHSALEMEGLGGAAGLSPPLPLLSPLPCTWNPPIMTLGGLVPLEPQFPQLLAKEHSPDAELSLGSEVKWMP